VIKVNWIDNGVLFIPRTLVKLLIIQTINIKKNKNYELPVQIKSGQLKFIWTDKFYINFYKFTVEFNSNRTAKLLEICRWQFMETEK
jgi:hypothetical protein